MALHLGAAFRLRQRLHAASSVGACIDPTVGAEAIFDPSGKVIHAEGLAKTRAAQEKLKEARRRFDDVRLREGSVDRIAAANQHRPLVDARWTLVDAQEPSGARYVVARENQAVVPGLTSLTERERQVVVLVALGRTSKEIAYALGISDSTARVLLSRAKAKFGVRTNDELISVVTRQALPGL
jgi:DNA-binding CsgD family transcriptional regulator